MEHEERPIQNTRWHVLSALCILCVSGWPAVGHATVVNGDFSSGLAGWVTYGDVTGINEAVLGDNGGDYSHLYQGIPLAAGGWRLEFDVLNLLSPDLPPGPFAFPDSLFASLFFINDIALFDLTGAVFDHVIPLFDMDFGGPFGVTGSFGASPLGGGWQRYSLDFVNSYGYVVPAFELFNLNTVTSDSTVHIDNVTLTPRTSVIPEPSTFALCGVGLVSMLCFGRASRSFR